MTDKVQKIREEVQKIARSINPYIPDDEGKNSEYEAGRFAMVTQIMQIIDSLQEEPVSEDLEEASKEWLRPQLDKSYVNYGEVKMMELTHFDGYAMLDAIEFGAKWQKAKDESTTEDLGEYINELSKQFPEVSFAKLSRIAVRVAKWQKQKDKSKVLTEEQCRKICNDAFELGKDAMKQQLMKDAVEGEIVKDIANNLYIGKAKVNKNNFKFGDKVKLLVLKEE